MKTLKEKIKTNIIPIIATLVFLTFLVLAVLHIIDLTNQGIINWNN